MTRKNEQYSNLRLGIVPILKFNRRILISIDSEWINFFDNDFTFEVRIDKNKNFVLVGPQVKLQPTKRNQHYSEEASINENNF